MKKLRVYCLFLILLAPFLLLWISCGRESPEETSNSFNLEDFQRENKVILKVEDSVYHNSDFENDINSIIENAKEVLTDASLSRLYDKFVDERIILQAARNQRIFLTSEEETEFLAKIRNQLWTEERDLIDIDTQLLRDKLLIEKYTSELLREIRVEDKEIEEYYNFHKKDFLQSERIKASQILVKTEDKAVEILAKIKDASEEDFRRSARQESLGPEAYKGGEMGWFELGQLPIEMESVIFSLKEGELSPVVKSSFGFHIFRLDKKIGLGLIPKERASTEIKLILLDQKIRSAISEHVENLKRSLKWEFFPQNLSFQYQGKNS